MKNAIKAIPNPEMARIPLTSVLAATWSDANLLACPLCGDLIVRVADVGRIVDRRADVTDTIRDLLEIAQRVEQLRTAPPAPLIRRQRDGPGYPDPKPVPERRSGPPGTPQRHPSGIDYRSKGMKP